MTDHKPEVKRYDMSACPEHICRVFDMEESEDGDYVEWEAYEALQAECEKLRKDAERYRWLRDQEALDNAICVLDCGEWVKPAMVIALAYSSAEQCDAAIDDAMRGDKP